MTIIIIGIVTVFTLPNIRPMMQRLSLRQTADTIHRQLITAKTRAIADPNTHVGVYFDMRCTPQKSLIFYDANSGNLNRFDGASIDETYLAPFELPRGIIMRLPASGPVIDSCIIFRGDGSAKNGGSIELTNEYNIKRTINVLASTGRIKVTAQ
jgi:hypothetical protein